MTYEIYARTGHLIHRFDAGTTREWAERRFDVWFLSYVLVGVGESGQRSILRERRELRQAEQCPADFGPATRSEG